jgi:hypothetical protein
MILRFRNDQKRQVLPLSMTRRVDSEPQQNNYRWYASAPPKSSSTPDKCDSSLLFFFFFFFFFFSYGNLKKFFFFFKEPDKKSRIGSAISASHVAGLLLRRPLCESLPRPLIRQGEPHRAKSPLYEQNFDRVLYASIPHLLLGVVTTTDPLFFFAG